MSGFLSDSIHGYWQTIIYGQIVLHLPIEYSSKDQRAQQDQLNRQSALEIPRLIIYGQKVLHPPINNYYPPGSGKKYQIILVLIKMFLYLY